MSPIQGEALAAEQRRRFHGHGNGRRAVHLDQAKSGASMLHTLAIGKFWFAFHQWIETIARDLERPGLFFMGEGQAAGRQASKISGADLQPMKTAIIPGYLGIESQLGGFVNETENQVCFCCSRSHAAAPWPAARPLAKQAVSK